MSEKIYGIDMGTNSIKIYQKAAGVILHQKNMIAMVKKKEPLALGDEEYSANKTNGISFCGSLNNI